MEARWRFSLNSSQWPLQRYLISPSGMSLSFKNGSEMDLWRPPSEHLQLYTMTWALLKILYNFLTQKLLSTVPNGDIFFYLRTWISFYLYMYVWVHVPACAPHVCLPGALRGQKTPSDLWYWSYRTVVSWESNLGSLQKQMFWTPEPSLQLPFFLPIAGDT